MSSERPGEELSHLDERGQARMVDVGAKAVTARRAVARASVEMAAATVATLRASESGRAGVGSGGGGETARREATGALPKGDVLATARIAGIMAAKRTPELIPLCHTVALTRVAVELVVTGAGVEVTATAEALDRTGVEMEALTAASVAALTVYDMLKAVDRGMVIACVMLVEKAGGRSGRWTRDADHEGRGGGGESSGSDDAGEKAGQGGVRGP